VQVQANYESTGSVTTLAKVGCQRSQRPEMSLQPAMSMKTSKKRKRRSSQPTS
jgi:hypothetical protein